MRFVLLFFWLITTLYITYGQVTGIKLQIKSQATIGKYDVSLIVQNGSALTTAQRLGYNSNFTIIVPTGSSVSIESTYNPVKTNGGVSWHISSTLVNPIKSDSLDYIQFIHEPAPQSLYPVLNNLDTIKLATLNITIPSHSCKEKIRLFVNGEDPSPSTPGFSGSDFRNGIPIGTSSNDWIGNHIPVISFQTVSSTQNSGGYSLRRACDCSTSGGIINIILPENDTLRLDSSIVINKNLTINGINNKSKIKMSGTNPIFEIKTNKTVNLSNLSLIPTSQNTQGKGILNYGNLVLNNVFLYRNSSISNSVATLANYGKVIFQGINKILKN